MAKRKRGEQITSGRVRENPFLCNQTLGSTADLSFYDVFIVLDQSSDGKLQRNSGGRLVSASLEPMLERILVFLGTCTAGSESLSKQDISNLLVPWATKCLLFLAAGARGDERDLDILWKILAQSMDTIITFGDDLSCLSQALSNQVLNKLAPFAVQTAVSTNLASIRIHSSRAFALFAEKLYRPSFDLYCGVLLADLVTQVVGAAVLTQGHLVLPNRELESIVLSSLQLLRTLQTVTLASPKKKFQALSREPVLLALSKLALIGSVDVDSSVEHLVKEVLWEAFFSPVNHIDGYRGIQLSFSDEISPKDRNQSFRCYQEDLLTSVGSLLAVGKHEVEIRALAHLVELLAEGFFVQALIWRRECHNQPKSKSECSFPTMLFRLWEHFARTLLIKLETGETVGREILVSSLTTCLKLLLDNDGYHPTYEDKHQHNFLVLKSMSSRLLVIVKEQRLSAGLQAIAYVIQLNHLLVHDDLPEVIAIATHCSQAGASKPFHHLICVLFNTYQQLRQLDYLVDALIGSMRCWDPIRQINQTNLAYATLRELFEDNEVVRTIVVSISGVPPGQTQALFNIFNTWIEEEMSLVENDDTRSVEPIAIVSGLFVLLMRSLRVDEHTSKQILPLCQASLVDFASALLVRSRNCVRSAELAKHGILLCGWILDLQNRCSFWSVSHVDEQSSLHQPEPLLKLLRALNASLTKPGAVVETQQNIHTTARYELQFLACYRIQQLHSHLHQQERDDFPQNCTSPSTREDFLSEARRLVDYVISTARCLNTKPLSTTSVRLCSAESTWVLLAKFLPAWTNYSDGLEIRVFLSWMFGALCGLDEKQAEHHSSIRHAFQVLSSNEVDKAAATALLSDTSFFENEKVMSEFVSSGLFHVQVLISTATRVRSSFSFLVDGCEDKYNWQGVSQSIRSVFADGVDLPPPKPDGSSVRPYFQAALQILNVLNTGPYGSRKFGHVCKILAQLLEMDISIRFLVIHTDDNGLVEAGLEVLAVVRSLFSKVLLESSHSTAKDFLCRYDWSVSLIEGVITSTIELSNCCSRPQLSTALEKLVISSCDLTESVSSICLDQQSFGALLKMVASSLFDSTSPLSEVTGRLVHSCAKGAEHIVQMDPLTVDELEKSLIDKIILVSRDTVAHQDSFPLHFIGNLLATSGFSTHPRGRAFIAKHVFSLNFPTSAVQFSFLTGVLLKGQPVESVSVRLYHHIAKRMSFESIDETVLCRLIATIPFSVFSDFVEHLVRPGLPYETGQTLRLLRLLLVSTDQLDRRQLIATLGAEVLGVAIEGLRTDPNNEPIQNNAAAQCLIELTKHKDIITLKERDIARILSEICCSLDDTNLNKHCDAYFEHVLSACAVVVSLIQRFPKQLYTCVASLILILRKLFWVVLHSDQNDLQLVDQGRAFARLSEMLGAHKEVFKKHILGLIQDFVDALSDNMTLVRRKALTPAVCFLLEMLTDYEVNQLSALLDTTKKAVFRSFYENYQIWHVYKGRF